MSVIITWMILEKC